MLPLNIDTKTKPGVGILANTNEKQNKAKKFNSKRENT
jgi:hypothetical protein